MPNKWSINIEIENERAVFTWVTLLVSFGVFSKEFSYIKWSLVNENKPSYDSFGGKSEYSLSFVSASLIDNCSLSIISNNFTGR